MFPKGKNQKELIHRSDWDILVILDACRYDYFEKVYEDYLDGDLQKVLSMGTHTQEWLKRTFGDGKYDDVVYISGNPYVNSRCLESGGFNAKKHFGKVVDVWDWGWDEKMNTVPPESLCKATKEAKVYYPNKRLIVHFMQPHFPYLSLGALGARADTPILDQLQEKGKKGEKNKSLRGELRTVIGNMAVNFLGPDGLRRMRIRRFQNRVRSLMGCKKLGYVGQVARKIGHNGLRKAYKKNLEIVLEAVTKLVEHLPGKIIITADHGEFLGEHGLYSHVSWCNDGILREVPWLEVED